MLSARGLQLELKKEQERGGLRRGGEEGGRGEDWGNYTFITPIKDV